LDDTLHPSSDIELPGDDNPNRFGGLDEILENSVDGVFIKNPKVPVSEDIYLQRFQFHTPLVRHILDGDRTEIGKPCSGTDRGEFRDRNRDFIVLKLILETLNLRKRGINSCSCMVFRIFRHKEFFLFKHHNAKYLNNQ